jgi:hypothetical protein
LREYPWVHDEMISSEASKKANFKLPADHKPGMRVPEGGSMCANCEYLKDAEKGLCGNPHFVKWNGSAQIPGDIHAYCSDWYEPA